MYLTVLANELVTAIKNADTSNFPGSGGSGLRPKNPSGVGQIPIYLALDPLAQLVVNGAGTASVFVIPGYKEFRFDDNRPRNTSIKKIHGHVITLAVGWLLSDQTSKSENFDIAPSEEWVKLVDFKDDLDRFIETLSLPSKAKLIEMEANPPDEVSLDSNRFYLVSTTLIYDAC